MMNKTKVDWRFRPGSEADLPLVEQVCAEIWGGQDYVPSSWLEWARDKRNQLFLIEAEGQPAGVYCLRIGLAGPGSSWVQGVRVAPAFRGQGLAVEIICHAVETSRQQGLQVLRYTTAEDNTPMHRIAQQLGFRYAGNFADYHFKRDSLTPVPTGLPYRLVTASEFDGTYHLITNSPEYRATEGFYCDRWWWKPLSLECLREHIERREVYSLTGTLKTVAIFSRTEENTFWLSMLTGDPTATQSLVSQLVKKGLACAPPTQKYVVNALLTQTELVRNTLPQAGFGLDKYEPVFYMYELALG